MFIDRFLLVKPTSPRLANRIRATLLPKLSIDLECRRGDIKLMWFTDPQPRWVVGLAWRKSSPRKRVGTRVSARPRRSVADTKEILLSHFPLLTCQKTDPKQARGKSIAGKGREPIGGVVRVGARFLSTAVLTS